MRGVLTPERSKQLLGVALLSLAIACGKASSSTPSLADLKASQVQANANADRQFETGEGELRVISRARFEDLVREGQIRRAAPGGAPHRPDELLIGLPKSALGKEHFFGGVVTTTTDKESEMFGGLKLSDLTPMHVYPKLQSSGPANVLSLVLEGCAKDCQPGFTQREALMEFPVSGQDETQVFIDFSVVGSDLNLVQIMDPDGEYLNLEAVSASTVEASYSHDTLLFDVLGLMKEKADPKNPQVAQAPKKVEFTTRWYLKRRYENANFKSQVATAGVGYFMTERFQTPSAQKHAHLDAQGNPIKTHYFVKNVPEEYRESFKNAFEDWNDTFEAKLGARILTYEFVNANDPLAATLVPGDVRVNVLEWDLVNKAGYGGLGPSIADQQTGAMISSNVLVQGPEIVNIYTEWFQVNQEAALLRDMGDVARADALLKDTRNRLFEEIQENKKAPKYALTLNGKYSFNVNSQDPRLQDEAASKLDFEILPEGLDYEAYMSGYFRELVAHELGHNMGLRHNFRGNLFASNDNSEGKVSASIMEYLGRPYRHKNRIAEYDLMAIDYGYALKAPTRTDMFCTDEGVGNIERHVGSAECSRDDADNDPYLHMITRFTRTRDLFIGKGSEEAPAWKKEDILPHFTKYSDGLLLYGESAERSLNTWIKFFTVAGRPAKNAAAVKTYVAKTLAGIVCEEGLEDLIKAEKGEAASRVALENLTELRNMTAERVTEVLGATAAAEITCAE